MEKFAAWPNIRHINSYRVPSPRISADEAREQRPTQKGKQSQGLYEYDAILQDDMAKIFKDGFTDRVQDSIHASECCTRAVYCIESYTFKPRIYILYLRHVYYKGGWFMVSETLE